MQPVSPPAPQRTPPSPPPVAAVPARSRMPGGDRRKQLLRVAIEIFARNGFSGTKTKDIAAAAGVSEAIVFRHFTTKEDLYHAILDEREDAVTASEFRREMEQRMKQRDDAGVLRCVAQGIVRSFRDDPAFHRLILYAMLEGHIIAELFRERFAMPKVDLLRRYLAMRKQEGVFRKCDAGIAQSLVAGVFVHFAMGRYVFGINHISKPDDVVIEEMVAFALNALTQNGVERPSKNTRSHKTVEAKKARRGTHEK